MEASIIITNYNYEKYVARAIRSALAQNCSKEDYEVIVVDDGSTDNSRAVIESFGKVIKPVFLEHNKGLAFARNHAIRMAQGRYVANLDSDDYIHNDFLHTGKLFLDMNKNFDAVSCDYLIINEHEEHIKRVDGGKKPIACGVLFRKERIIEIGLYDENFRAWEDEDLRIRFIKKGYLTYNIPLPLYRYRQHHANLTKNKKYISKYKRLLKKKHI